MKNPFKKISKKTILIASILVILIGVPVLAYFYLNEETEDTSAWYDNSWLYRRSITVNNAGGTLTNEDVLITLDTATLISAGKLQADCDDLRFVDSNDSTSLQYWIEAGCNSSTTQIWIRVPSVPTGGKNIYLYYGNSAATVGSASWSGNFLMLANATCPSGWTRDTSFDSKHIMINSSYGTEGGSDTHNHGTTSILSDYNDLSEIGGFPTGADTNKLAYRHRHTYQVSCGNTSTLPVRKSVVICYKNKLDNLTSNLLSVQINTTDSNWTSFSGFDNYYLYGSSSYGTIGGNSTHSHSTTGGVDTDSLSTYGYAYIAFRPTIGGALYTHQHTTNNGTTNASNTDPSYIATRFLSPNSTTTRAFSGIGMLVSSIPPYGWSSNSSYNGKLLKGNASLSTGGSDTHRHYLTITASASSLNTGDLYMAVIGGESASRESHTHYAMGYTSYVSSFPSYRTAILAERKTSLTTSIAAYPSGEEISNSTPTAPTSLQTEGQTNPTQVGDLTPEFSAIFNDPDSGDTGTYYEIEVNTNSSFTGTVMWDSGKTTMTSTTNGTRSPDLSYAGTALTTNGTTYYWRIKFWDYSDSEGPWSSTAQFTMNTPPTSPTELQVEEASNPSGIFDTRPEFRAKFQDPDSGDTGIYYEIEVNTNSSFTGAVMWDTGQVSMAATAIGAYNNPQIEYGATNPLVLDGTTYYWRIRFTDSHGTIGAWSSTAQFTMNTPPSAPTSLLTEEVSNPNKIYDTTPEFSAIFNDPDGSDTGAYYQIEVNTLSDFTGTSMWDSTKTSMTSTANGARSPDISYAGTSLPLDGNIYYWRIRFWDNYDTQGAWSSTASFRMSGPPNPPTDLLFDGKTNPSWLSTQTPVLSAIHSDINGDSATYYEVEVNASSDFTGIVKWDSGKQPMTSTSTGTRSSDLKYTGTPLENSGSTFYWRIRFWDTDDNVGQWSSTASFVETLNYTKMNSVGLEGLTIF